LNNFDIRNSLAYLENLSTSSEDKSGSCIVGGMLSI